MFKKPFFVLPLLFIFCYSVFSLLIDIAIFKLMDEPHIYMVEAVQASIIRLLVEIPLFLIIATICCYKNHCLAINKKNISRLLVVSLIFAGIVRGEYLLWAFHFVKPYYLSIYHYSLINPFINATGCFFTYPFSMLVLFALLKLTKNGMDTNNIFADKKRSQSIHFRFYCLVSYAIAWPIFYSVGRYALDELSPFHETSTYQQIFIIFSSLVIILLAFFLTKRATQSLFLYHYPKLELKATIKSILMVYVLMFITLYLIFFLVAYSLVLVPPFMYGILYPIYNKILLIIILIGGYIAFYKINQFAVKYFFVRSYQLLSSHEVNGVKQNHRDYRMHNSLLFVLLVTAVVVLILQYLHPVIFHFIDAHSPHIDLYKHSSPDCPITLSLFVGLSTSVLVFIASYQQAIFQNIKSLQWNVIFKYAAKTIFFYLICLTVIWSVFALIAYILFFSPKHGFVVDDYFATEYYFGSLFVSSILSSIALYFIAKQPTNVSISNN